MPLYEYVCKECGFEVELLQGYDAKNPKCKKCEAEMKRKLSKTSFSLKGGGWYKDHYGLKPSKPKGGTE